MEFTFLCPHPDDGRFTKTAFDKNLNKKVILNIDGFPSEGAVLTHVEVDDAGAHLTFTTDSNIFRGDNE